MVPISQVQILHTVGVIQKTISSIFYTDLERKRRALLRNKWKQTKSWKWVGVGNKQIPNFHEEE